MAGKGQRKKRKRTTGRAGGAVPKTRRRRRVADKPAADSRPELAEMLEGMGNGSLAGKIERELVEAALAKQRDGKLPTPRELSALQRFERACEEQRRWETYHSIPQKHWRAMAGRQAKVINEQATRYGIPFGGATIDLPAVVKALHDFLAANARKLAAINGDDPLMAGGDSPALERYRHWRAELAELELGKRREDLLPREQVHEMLARLAPILRGCGDQLQRHCGREALQILDEHLTVWEREVTRRLGNGKARMKDE